MTRPSLFLLPLFLSLTLPVGCGDRTLELVEDESTPREGLTDPGRPDGTRKVNNSPETPVRPAEDRMDQFQVAGTRIMFRDLSIPPAFHWENPEYRLFQHLHQIVLAWERASYRSTEEEEFSAFFQLVLQALLEDEDLRSAHFRALRAYALPLFLRKEIPPRHRPAFTPADLEKEALQIYKRGFNLNFTRESELTNFLKNFAEKGWRDHAFVPQDPLPTLETALRDDTSQLDRENLQSSRRCAQLVSRKPRQEAACDFGRYELRWSPTPGGHPTMTLTVSLDTGRGRELFQEMMTGYQGRPGWLPPGLELPQLTLEDDYVLTAAGPDPLTFGPLTPPGAAAWPQNLRQSDWEDFAPQVLDATTPPEVRAAMSTCGASILDSLAVFTRYANRINWTPGVQPGSSRLSPPHEDADLLRRTRILLWFLHATGSGHHLALGLKAGCEGQVLRFLAVRTLWLLAAQGQQADPEAASLVLLFRTLVALRPGSKPATTAAAPGSAAAPGPAAPGPAPAPGPPALADLLDPKELPELDSHELVLPRVEAAWVLLQQPDGFIGVAAGPNHAGIRLFAPTRLKDVRAALERLDLRRTFLPALLRLTPDRLSYRRGKDALDYFLQFAHEARRARSKPR